MKGTKLKGSTLFEWLYGKKLGLFLFCLIYYGSLMLLFGIITIATTGDNIAPRVQSFAYYLLFAGALLSSLSIFIQVIVLKKKLKNKSNDK